MAPGSRGSFEHADDADDELSLGQSLLVVALLIGLTLLCLKGFGSCLSACCGRLCCFMPCCSRCRKKLLKKTGENGNAARLVRVGKENVQSIVLKQKKELTTAYMLMLTVGLTGAHHFYLERLVHGACCLWSLNFFCLGFLVDIFMMPFYVNSANRGSAAAAHKDGSSSRILWRSPCICLLIVVAPIVILFSIPSALHTFQVLDLDKAGAGTQKNPYDILGVQPRAADDVKYKAFEHKMFVFKRQKRCDRTCEAEKKELQKAYDYAAGVTFKKYQKKKDRENKKKGGKRQKDRANSWDEWGSRRTYDWEIMIDIMKNQFADWAKGDDTSESGEQHGEGAGRNANDEL